MSMLKTRPTGASVVAFLSRIPDPDRRKEARRLATLIRRVTRAKPVMWGSAIIGYGKASYTMSSGKEVDWFPVGFALRKNALTLYLMGGVKPHAALLKRLGRHKVSGSCLHVPRFDQVDDRVLSQIVARTWKRRRGE